MKKLLVSSFFMFLLLTVALGGCVPAATAIPVSIPSTFTPSPIPPTDTPEPTATNTPEPTLTPIPLPNTLIATFSNLSILHRDSFEFVLENTIPVGWVCDEKYAAWITQDNQFKIQPASDGSGTVFYFQEEKLTANKGVFFTFKYTGEKETFTLGLDSVGKNGDRIPFGESGFYSVAMQRENTVTSAHIIKEGWQNSDFFDGNLKLREDTWYEIALGLDDNNNYIIKIWQPEAPEQQITYFKKWDDFPDEYYFISWISSKRSLLIDDFTVFKFDEIIQK